MAINYDFINKKRAEQAQRKTQQSLNRLGNRFGDNFDPNTSEGLYNLAMQQGGQVSEVIGEIADPRRSFLSASWDRIKNIGGGIIDALNTPNEIVAGVIESVQGENNLSLGENIRKAMRDDLSASEALLGEFNSKDKSGLQKAGNFVLRTGIDILLDPLTYVTGGASRGIMGLSAAPKFTAGSKLAAQIGTKQGKAVALAKGAGDDLLGYTDELAKGASDNVLQPIKERLLKAGISEDILNGVVKEQAEQAAKLLDSTVIDFDAGRKALTEIMELAPELAPKVLDKGGIKFFGKSILEGQKIRLIRDKIPVMKYIDKETEDFRMALGSMFNPNIRGNFRTGFKRIPEEYRNYQKQLGRFKKMQGAEFSERLEAGMKGLGYKTADEINFAIGNALTGKIPADGKLASVYKLIHELKGDAFLSMKKAGKNTSYLVNHFPRMLTNEDVVSNFKSFKNGTLSESITAAKQKKNVVFESISNAGKKVFGGADEAANIKLVGTKEIIEKGIDAGVVQEAVQKQASLLGDEIDKIASMDLRNKDELIHEIFTQKKAIENGKLDSVFLDEDTGEVFIRRGATVNESLDLMEGFSGNIKDINFLESFNQASLQTLNQSASAAFVRDLSRLGIKASEAPDGFRKLNIDKNIMDSLGKEDMFFSEEVATNLEKMVGMMNEPKFDKGVFFEGYDAIQSIWKSSVTSMFPSFHARNAVSNVFLNFADIGFHSFNPQTYVTSASIIKNNNKYDNLFQKMLKAETANPEEAVKIKSQIDDLLSTPIFEDARGHKWTFGQMQETLKSKNIAFTDEAVATKRDELLTGKKTLTQKLDKDNENIVKKGMRTFIPVYKDFFGYKGGQAVGNAIENHGRLVNFLTNLEKTGDVSLAASRTKQFLFDYSDLTDFEKNVMRRIIPFYSFTRFNLEAQAKVLMETPGKAAAQFKAMDTFTDVFSDDDLTDEQKEKIPSWMKRGFYYMKKQKDGTLKSISVTESPVEQPLSAFSAKGVLGSISPLVRVPIEQMTGYDMYQGKVFSDATNASGYKFAPKIIKDYIGYEEVEWYDDEGNKQVWSVSLRPSRLNLINNTPLTARVTSSLRQVTDSDNTKRQRAMQLLFGTYYKDVDMDKVLRYEEKETLKQYTDVLDTAGVLYQFKRNIVSKDQ